MYTSVQRDDFSARIFANYLNQTKEQAFVLDLSNASLLEIIDELIAMKSKMSPRYGRGFTCLINNLRLLEKQFNCVLVYGCPAIPILIIPKKELNLQHSRPQ
jgi:hypothetical protein